MVNEPDLEWKCIDGTIVKIHQHSAGVVNNNNQGLGKSVAGNATKTYMAVDGLGFPIEFQITGDEVHDSKVASELINNLW